MIHLIVACMLLSLPGPLLSGASGVSGSGANPGPASPASAASAICVTDAAGRNLVLETLPQRIVVVGRAPFMPIHLLAMFPEGRSRLTGYERKFKLSDPFMTLVDPGYPGKTALGTNPGPEHILSLHPDLVIMKGTALDATGVSLGTLNVPMVYLGMETPDMFFKDIHILGQVLGNPARAREILAFYRSRLERIETRVQGLTPSEKPGVLTLYYTTRAGTAATRVPAPAWTQTIQVEAAGGRPLWLDQPLNTDNWTVTNFEQIARWNPDKIFLIVDFRQNPAEALDSLKKDPSWRLLPAVRNGEVVVFPTDIFGWDSPDPRWLLGLEWLAKAIHPGLFPDLDMTDEIHAFFTGMYGLDNARVETRIMPEIRLDLR